MFWSPENFPECPGVILFDADSPDLWGFIGRKKRGGRRIEGGKRRSRRKRRGGGRRRKRMLMIQCLNLPFMLLIVRRNKLEYLVTSGRLEGKKT